MPVFSASIYGNDTQRGLSIAGLPGLSFKSGEGFKYGGRIALYQYLDGSIQPFEWNFTVQATKTTMNRTDMFVFVDVPHVSGLNTRLDVYANYNRDVFDDFYGLGNNSSNEPGLSDEESDHFFNYKRKWHSLLVNYQLPFIIPKMRFLIGVGFVHTLINSYGHETLLSMENPFGLKGGSSHYIRCGIVYDKRDEETVPRKGMWSEILLEQTSALFGSDYSYSRLTITDRRYWSILRNLVYAQRVIYETMPGNPPFYEMTVISGSYSRQEGLGGAYSLRGVPRFLFIGPNKLVVNMELRYHFMSLVILKQRFTFYVHGFVDTGRVWLKEEKQSLSHLHTTHGIGLHVRWNQDFIASADVGQSRYNNFAVYITFGNLF